MIVVMIAMMIMMILGSSGIFILAMNQTSIVLHTFISFLVVETAPTMGTVMDGEALKGAVLSESHASYKATVPYMFLGVGIILVAAIGLALVALSKKFFKKGNRETLQLVHPTLLGNLQWYL